MNPQPIHNSAADQHQSRKLPRWLTLFIISWFTGMASGARVGFDILNLGPFSVVLIAFVPALVISSLVWLVIRKSDPAAFQLLSISVGICLGVTASLFLWQINAYLSRSGIGPDHPYAIGLVWPSAVLCLLGFAITSASLFRRRKLH